MTRLALIAIGGGSVSAMISMSFMAGSVFGLFLAYLAPLPLFLVGLGLGPVMGAVAGVAGAAIVGGVGGFLLAATFALVNALPVGLAVHQALRGRTAADGGREWVSHGGALAGLSLFGGLALVVAAALSWGDGQSFPAAVESHIAATLKAMVANLPPEQTSGVVATLAPLFPGLVSASWIVMLAINGVVAQSVLARGGWAIRPNERFRDLVLPDWASWPLVGAAVAGLIGPGDLAYLGRNLVLVAGLPFLFLGLAVVHGFARRIPHHPAALAAFYFVLVVSGWPVFAVAGVGMIEQWAGLRRRFAAPRNGRENKPWN